jgi:hypothetical protein
MEEIWKVIKGFDNYFISNLGNVKSIRRSKEKILKPNNYKNYPSVVLFKNKIPHCRKINSIVSEAFLNFEFNSQPKKVIFHKDGNSMNVNSNNLEIISQKENRDRIYKKKYNCTADIKSSEYGRIGYILKREKITREEFFKNREKYDISKTRKKHLHLDLYSPEYYKTIWLKKKYNISLEDYNNTLVSQNNCCLICKLPETSISNKNNKVISLSVDHCHTTGKVRGLLCSNCNKGLGCFKDNISFLKEAIEYLNNNI